MKNLIFLLATVSLFYACNNSNIIIVGDGKANATIITSLNPDSLTIKAAAELQTYIQKISGHTIPILNENDHQHGVKIFVGEVRGFAHQPLEKEEILIQSKQNDLIIKGGDPMSTLYAVYTFLEDILGCRFYTPDYELYLNEARCLFLLD